MAGERRKSEKRKQVSETLPSLNGSARARMEVTRGIEKNIGVKARGDRNYIVLEG